MLVKFLAGPKAGAVEKHSIHPATLQVLVSAGLIEFFPEPKSQYPTTSLTWTVDENLETGSPSVKVSCSCGGEWAMCKRPTEKFSWAHCGVRETIPPDVYEKFLKAKNRGEAPETAERRTAVQAARSAGLKFVD
jgi:hypothetical protein